MNKPEKRPKAYAYARWSTPEQSHGDSSRRQSEGVLAFCEKHGLELDNELTMVDAGLSAFHGDNLEGAAALGAFLMAVRMGVVDRGSWLLVENIDRLSRKAAWRAARIVQDLCEAGISVATLDDGKVYNEDVLDKDMFPFIELIFQFARGHGESKRKQDMIRKVWQGKRASASQKRLTSICPGWIEPHGETAFRLIPHRATVVRRIVADIIRGESVNRILHQLNAEKVPVFGRAKFWGRGYINKILESPALRGDFVPHTEEKNKAGKRVRVPQETIKGYYPAVLSELEYARLHEAWQPTRMRGAHATRPMNSIVGMIAHCPVCDSHMTRVTKGAKKGGRPRLVCTRAKNGAGCKYVGVYCDLVETAILENVDWLAAVAPVSDEGVDRDAENAARTVEAIESRLEELKIALKRRFTRTVEDLVAETEAELEEAREVQREADARVMQATSKLHAVRVNELGVACRAKPLNRNRINAALRGLISKIVIDYRTGYLVLTWKTTGTTTELLYAMQGHATAGRAAVPAHRAEAVAATSIEVKAAERAKRAAGAAPLEGDAHLAKRSARTAMRR